MNKMSNKKNFSDVKKQIGIKIPDSVLVDILLVYECGTEENLNEIPNDLICDFDGNFWTTWKKVFEIRSRICKWKHREILFRKFENIGNQK